MEKGIVAKNGIKYMRTSYISSTHPKYCKYFKKYKPQPHCLMCGIIVENLIRYNNEWLCDFKHGGCYQLLVKK